MKLLYPLILSSALVSASPLRSLSDSTPHKRQDDASCGDYESVMLYNINFHRSNHSVADLVWNDTLAEAALATSENGEVLVHDADGKGWGQNLYAWYNGDLNDFGLTPAAAIDSWYNGEFSNYDAYGDKGLLDLQNHPDDWMPPPAVPDGDYMHFTALIWKNTASVGCATSRRDTDYFGIYTVCNFYPPGNSVSSNTAWVDNVLPPLGMDYVQAVCPPVAP